MSLIISYPSAAYFWMQNTNFEYHDKFLYSENYHSIGMDEIAISFKSDFFESIANRYNLPLLLHTLSGSANSRKSSPFCQSHLCRHLPDNAFIDLGLHRNSDGDQVRVYVASPEFCFLQSAEKLSFLELIKFGYDMCSKYLQGESKRWSREPITSVSRIETFLSEASWTKGIFNAKRALKHIVDRSYSPMETEMCMFAVLPYSLGGFSIEKPELNLDVFLSKNASTLLGRNSCSCDMVWFDKKTVVEYDSSQYHLTHEAHTWDKAKETALTGSGYKTICLTQDSFKNVTSVNAAYSQIRSVLGLRNNPRRLRETWSARSQLLKFFAKMRSESPLAMFSDDEHS